MPSPVASAPFLPRPAYAAQGAAKLRVEFSPAPSPSIHERHDRLAGLERICAELPDQASWRRRFTQDALVLVRGGVTLNESGRHAWLVQPRALLVPAGHTIELVAAAGAATVQVLLLPTAARRVLDGPQILALSPRLQLALEKLRSLRHARARHFMLLLGNARLRAPDYVEPGPRNARSSRDRHARLVFDTQAILLREFGQNQTVPDLASRLNSSPFHLARLFRRTTGCSIHEYRHALRMGAALSRLQSARGDLAEIALDLGFSSHSHFSAAFRNYFGRAPSLCLRRFDESIRAA